MNATFYTPYIYYELDLKGSQLWITDKLDKSKINILSDDFRDLARFLNECADEVEKLEKEAQTSKGG